eukprot:snap_masked-scaffold_18-processed-gene-6.44-mRNA-1 protein AED:1.00 eAED:1.00 QI:0/0/0/0/1/1/2/0/101
MSKRRGLILRNPALAIINLGFYDPRFSYSLETQTLRCQCQIDLLAMEIFIRVPWDMNYAQNQMFHYADKYLNLKRTLEPPLTHGKCENPACLEFSSGGGTL